MKNMKPTYEKMTNKRLIKLHTKKVKEKSMWSQSSITWAKAAYMLAKLSAEMTMIEEVLASGTGVR